MQKNDSALTEAVISWQIAWLTSIIFDFQYQYADIAKRDILHAFRTYTDLRPKLDTFGKSTKIFGVLIPNLLKYFIMLLTHYFISSVIFCFSIQRWK